MSMSTTAPATPVTDGTVPSRSVTRTRSARLLAPFALVAGAVLMAVGLGLHQVTLSGFEAEDVAQINQIAAHSTQWLAAHLLSSIGLILVAAGMMAVVRIASKRGARVARSGAAAASVGAIFMSLGDIAHGSVSFAVAGQVGSAEALAAEKAFFSDPMIGMLMAPGTLLPLGVLVLGAGLLLSRLVPRWAGIVILTSPIFVQVGLSGAIPSYLFPVPFVVGMTVLASTVSSEDSVPAASTDN